MSEPYKNVIFGELFVEAVNIIIASRKNKLSSKRAIYQELGEAVGKSAYTIERWKQGKIPRKFSLNAIESLTSTIVEISEVDKVWLRRILNSVNYPYTNEWCEKLFPAPKRTDLNPVAPEIFYVYRRPRKE